MLSKIWVKAYCNLLSAGDCGHAVCSELLTLDYLVILSEHKKTTTLHRLSNEIIYCFGFEICHVAD